MSMRRIVVIPNEEFSSYFPQYTFEKIEKYFNPNLKFETHIISLDENEYKTVTKIGTLVIHPVGFFRGRFIRHFWRILKAIWVVRKHKVDLVRTYNTFQYGFVAMLAAKINRRPFILSLHSDYDRAIRSRGKNYLFWHTLEKIVIRNANSVIVVSPYLYDYARRHGAKGVAVIPNPLNLEPFLRKSENAPNIRSRYGLIGKTVLIFVGRYYDPAKNFVRLLQAFSEIGAELREKTHLLVVGRGGEKREYFNNLISQLGLNSKITFVGFLCHSHLPAYYQASDIFVLPSIYEGLPTSLIEAMAAGLPALTSSHPSMTYLVNSENGVTVDPYNVKEIARRLGYLIQMDSEGRRKLGKLGQQRIINLFHEKSVYNELEKLYLSLIRKGA